jgi:DNA adenine methylase
MSCWRFCTRPRLECLTLDNIARNDDPAEMTYPGGKNGAGVYQTIINHMPPHEMYVEPFLGGGAIMRLKRPAAVNVGIDRAAGVIASFKEWRSRLVAPGGTTRFGGGRRRRSSLPARSAETVRAGDGGRGLDPLARAGDGGHQLRTPTPSTSSLELAIADPVIFADPSSFFFHHANAIPFLARRRFPPGALVYCDPPYMHETRGRSDTYEFEMTNAQHENLLRILKVLPCRVLISGYWTSLYAEMLEDWNHSTFTTTNRAGNRTTEWLWYNFEKPLELHDYRYLGTNFRERERIKRKKARWVARIRRQSPLEHQALLAALVEASTARSDEQDRTGRKRDGSGRKTVKR